MVRTPRLSQATGPAEGGYSTLAMQPYKNGSSYVL